MTYHALMVNVMIASPSDVIEEREIAKDVILMWNASHSEEKKICLMPVGWETHTAPEMGDRPQAIINKQLADKSDLLVGIFWTRLGTSTGSYNSGTVEEIQRFRDDGKGVMLYFSRAQIDPSRIDTKQYDALQEFRKSCMANGLVVTYQSPEDFRQKFSNQLAIYMKDYSQKYGQANRKRTANAEKWNNSDPAHIIRSLSHLAIFMLVGAAQDPRGEIKVLSTGRGDFFVTNLVNLSEPGNNRQKVKCIDAITELINLGLLSSDYGRPPYVMTSSGYDVADKLSGIDIKQLVLW